MGKDRQLRRLEARCAGRQRAIIRLLESERKRSGRLRELREIIADGQTLIADAMQEFQDMSDVSSLATRRLEAMLEVISRQSPN